MIFEIHDKQASLLEFQSYLNRIGQQATPTDSYCIVVRKNFVFFYNSFSHGILMVCF